MRSRALEFLQPERETVGTMRRTHEGRAMSMILESGAAFNLAMRPCYSLYIIILTSLTFFCAFAQSRCRPLEHILERW